MGPYGVRQLPLTFLLRLCICPLIVIQIMLIAVYWACCYCLQRPLAFIDFAISMGILVSLAVHWHEPAGAETALLGTFCFQKLILLILELNYYKEEQANGMNKLFVGNVVRTIKAWICLWICLMTKRWRWCLKFILAKFIWSRILPDVRNYVYVRHISQHYKTNSWLLCQCRIAIASFIGNLEDLKENHVFCQFLFLQ